MGYTGGGTDTTHNNPDGYLYITGDAITEGSVRFAIDGDTGFAEIEKLLSGIWQPASLLTGANSLWVGRAVGLAGVGHHLVTEAVDGHLHFHADSTYIGGITTEDTTVLNAFSYNPHMAVVPDESGEWTGTEYTYNYPSTDHRLFKNVYFKTGATTASEQVRFRVWKGTDETGDFIFDQAYPSSQFPANTEILVQADGNIEFDTGVNYFVKVSSSATFSLKTTADLLYPYTYGDISLVRDDSMLQTAPYVDGGTYSLNQWLIQDRKIYACNTVGVQNGTFTSNAALWDILGTGSTVSTFWEETSGNLHNKAGSTSFTLNDGTSNRLNIGSGGSTISSPNGTRYISISNSNIAGHSNGLDVFGFSDTQSYIWAANTSNYMAIADSTFIFRDGTRNRLYINDIASRLYSPDGTNSLIIDDTKSEITGPFSVVGDTTLTGDTNITGYTTLIGNLDVSTSMYQPVFKDNYGLRMHTPFDEIGTDKVQYDRSGFLFDASPDLGANPVVTSTGGLHDGPTGVFNGTDDFYSSGKPLSGITSSFTFEAFLNPLVTPVQGNIITHYATSHTTELLFDSSNQFQGIVTFSDSSALGVTSNVMTLDEWYHVAMTYDGANIKLYVNGITVATTASTKTIDWDTGYINFTLGGTPMVGQYFNGKISDTKVYSRALSADEVRTHYLRGGDGVVNAESFRVIDDNRARLTIHSLASALVSPDGDSTIGTVDGLAYFADSSRNRIYSNTNDTSLISPNGVNHITINNAGAAIVGNTLVTGSTIALSDGIKNRLLIDSGYTTFTSPTGGGGASDFATWSLANTGHLLMVDGNDRELIDATGYIYKDPTTKERVTINSSSTKLLSPNEVETFKVDNTGLVTTSTVLYTPTEFYIYDGARSRLLATTTGTTIVSQNGTYQINADNTGVILKANSTTNLVVQPTLMYFNDATRDRIKANSTDSRLVSPDGTNTLKVNNTETDISGQLTVGSTSGTLVLAPTSPDYGGGAMLIKGGGDGAGGFYADYHMDHFWGDLRIYVQSTPTVQFELNNIGAGGLQLGVGLANTNIWANLDVNGSGTSGIGLQLRSGCSSTTNVASQIVMAFNGLAYGQSGYAHSIKTKHNDGTTAGNSMDFYLWDHGVDSANALGTYKVLSLDREGINMAGDTSITDDTTVNPGVLTLADQSLIWGFNGWMLKVDATASAMRSPNLATSFQVTDTALTCLSTTAPFFPSSMTTTERDSLAVANGAMIYNITTNKFQGYENGAWASLI